MSGRTELTMIAVTTLSLISAFTDLRSGKIFNWLTVTGALTALGCAAFGWSDTSLFQSLFGLAVGFGAFVWLYALGFLGAGDVKLLMALGAWSGPHFALETAVLSVILGAAMAAVILLVKGRMGVFLFKLKVWLGSVFVRELRWMRPEWDRSLRMAFGVPIAIAAIAETFGNPLVAWGVHLW